MLKKIWSKYNYTLIFAVTLEAFFYAMIKAL